MIVGATFLATTVLPSSLHSEEAAGFQPILAQTKGKGPAEKVVAFKVNPDVYTTRVMKKRFVSAPTLEAIADDSFGNNQEQLEQAGRAEGWSQFGFWFGAGGAVGTLAEHVVKFEGLGGINNAMTNLGLFMTVWQVGLDLSSGDNSAAGRNAYKGLLGFATGKWGWSTLQAASVIWFIVDVTLTEFGTSAWLAREDYWRKVYSAYYREKDAAAHAAQFGQQAGYLSPTLEQQVKNIRSRREGGRSVNEWKILLAHYFGHASSPERFSDVIENELDLYVSKFWTSAEFEEYAADTGGSTWGIAKGASLTDGIKKALEDEHKATLKAMFAKKIFPELAHKAWVEGLEREVGKLNRDVAPDLNSTIDIDVSAYDLKAPARFVMPKPAGGEWSGTLQPGKTRTLRITKLAFIKAGLPDRIVLDTDSGTKEERIIFTGLKGVAVFGTPKATVVTVLDRSESELSCTIRTSTRDGKTSTSSETRPANVSPTIHTSVAPDMVRVLFGDYDPGSGWRSASPGAVQADGSTSFAAPYFEDIVALDNCSSAFLKGDVLSGGSCRVKRQRHEKTIDGRETEITCYSNAQFSLKGVYLPQGGVQQYYPLDGPQGEIVRNVLKESMKHGFAPAGVPQQ
ncbi:hypothetical protein [Roseibium sp.]|uniref:hypothetical protein n=1 Tax=Roseibium sp. TaxID=1936156 RepID=UPI003A982073